ncbi:MAG TPA: hypothetical protein VIS99_12915 [Terrimicrobiaceae bacterium]
MRILVSGLIGQYAFGGVTWDYIQYLLGFRALGHDVWYLEDPASWPYDPVKEAFTAECSHNVSYVDRIMREFDFGDRWIYRNDPDGKYYGVHDEDLAEKAIAAADVLVNVSGSCWLRPVTAGIKTKLFLDGDPMFTQIRMIREPLYLDRVRAHERHFTFGLNIGRPECKIPPIGLHWRPTIQPVAIDCWDNRSLPRTTCPAAVGAWTTVMNWASYDPEEFRGEAYGQKDLEFKKFLELPSQTNEKFVLAMGHGPGKKRPTEYLESLGWCILEPDTHVPDYASYRDFLINSKAEWSIAKNGYVKSHSGWFSCRSACYLAAGRPVVVQDTGWSNFLPSGDGALCFSTLEEATVAIEEVAKNYEHHCEAARAYARAHFDASKVCADLLE